MFRHFYEESFKKHLAKSKGDYKWDLSEAGANHKSFSALLFQWFELSHQTRA